jgi:hypothetical protein
LDEQISGKPSSYDGGTYFYNGIKQWRIQAFTAFLFMERVFQKKKKG